LRRAHAQEAERASTAREALAAIRERFAERRLKHPLELQDKSRREFGVGAMQPRHDLHSGPNFCSLELEIADRCRNFADVPELTVSQTAVPTGTLTGPTIETVAW